SDDYVAIASKAEQDLRDLLDIPSDYKVLFLQGGASQQFAEIPLNLLPEDGVADYIDTGIWSKKAIEEARRYGTVNVAASAKEYDYFAIPGQNEWTLTKDAAYVHYASNETIGGLEFDWIPETGDVPLVTDMSSDILSRPLDVSRFGLIYAGAQKNIGPSGLVVVIVREDLLGRARSVCPTMLNYKIAADNGSMYNTPATYSWYLSGLVFEWLKEQGGVTAMEQRNRAWELLNDIPGVSCVKPMGALYAFPRIDPKVCPIHNDEKFVLDLLLSEKLLIVQGTAFNWPWPDHFRVVTLPRVDDLEQAILRIGSFLKGYQQ
ncbi:MAG: 3-phosphoserine/phosphohydroxythreonine transaminase, partial [Pseudomonas aeruginosa]|nr:3-phosphoserine/phosphohydroxythreonine transaminase [Pseudomonas aeruginosa]